MLCGLILCARPRVENPLAIRWLVFPLRDLECVQLNDFARACTAEFSNEEGGVLRQSRDK
jgi:hypothetical protein